MKQYLENLMDQTKKLLDSSEEFVSFSMNGEQTYFTRFNQAKVRQQGQVSQYSLSICFALEGKNAQYEFFLTAQESLDLEKISKFYKNFKATYSEREKDSFYSVSTAGSEASFVNESQSSSFESFKAPVQDICSEVAGTDFVGIYAGGLFYRAFLNSNGQSCWHQIANHNLDYCLYYSKDKAIKNNYSDLKWNRDSFSKQIEFAKQGLKALSKSEKKLQPGDYRVYLSPKAVSEVLGIMNWRCFSEESFQVKESPLFKMKEESKNLSSLFNLSEDYSSGINPLFTKGGHKVPELVKIIDSGRLVGSLTNSRAAKEFSLNMNAASGYLTSPVIGAGKLVEDDILKRLDTGVYISDLWYTNYSELPTCRITGMTRFASFWVEKGEIIAPISVMRFDDSVYSFFGEQLEDLTQQQQLISSAGSYRQRDLGAEKIPGALIKKFHFAL